MTVWNRFCLCAHCRDVQREGGLAAILFSWFPRGVPKQRSVPSPRFSPLDQAAPELRGLQSSGLRSLSRVLHAKAFPGLSLALCSPDPTVLPILLRLIVAFLEVEVNSLNPGKPWVGLALTGFTSPDRAERPSGLNSAFHRTCQVNFTPLQLSALSLLLLFFCLPNS